MRAAAFSTQACPLQERKTNLSDFLCCCVGSCPHSLMAPHPHSVLLLRAEYETLRWGQSKRLVLVRLSSETSGLGGTLGRRAAPLLFLKEGVEPNAHARAAKGQGPSEDREGGARKSERQRLRYLVPGVSGFMASASLGGNRRTRAPTEPERGGRGSREPSTPGKPVPGGQADRPQQP